MYYNSRSKPLTKDRDIMPTASFPGYSVDSAGNVYDIDNRPVPWLSDPIMNVAVRIDGERVPLAKVIADGFIGPAPMAAYFRSGAVVGQSAMVDYAADPPKHPGDVMTIYGIVFRQCPMTEAQDIYMSRDGLAYDTLHRRFVHRIFNNLTRRVYIYWLDRDNHRHTVDLAKMVYQTWNAPLAHGENVDFIDHNVYNTSSDNLVVVTVPEVGEKPVARITKDQLRLMWIMTTQENPISVGDACRKAGLDPAFDKMVPGLMYKMRKGLIHRDITDEYPLITKRANGRRGTFDDNPERAEEIRRLYATGQYTMNALTERYGVSRDVIRTVVKDIHMVGGRPRQSR